MQRKIAWEKFVPRHEHISDEEPEDPKATVETNDKESEEWSEEQEEEHDDEEGQHIVGSVLDFFDIGTAIAPKIKTPFGYYDINDDFSPYNMFDCWVGHCNFRISSADIEILDNKINGIGCLKILSPYRFFIGIEKMFTFPAVRIQIQKDLCQSLEMDDYINGQNDVDYIINMVLSKINDAIFSIKDAEKWAIFIGGDGEIESIKYSDFANDLEYRANLAELQSMKNGNIITFDSV